MVFNEGEGIDEKFGWCQHYFKMAAEVTVNIEDFSAYMDASTEVEERPQLWVGCPS